MRLIQVSDEPVVAVAVSHDGRLLAASTGPVVSVFEWGSGQRLLNARQRDARQLAFSPDGEWLAACGGDQLVLWRTADGVPVQPPRPPRCKFASGVGFSPDGKHLFASRETQRGPDERLERWSMPDAKLVAGFDYCPAFPRLAFSPDGQYIGGVSDRRYELRIAVTGGLNARLLMRGEIASAFTTFSPDSTRAVVGWDAELHVLETQNGKVVHRLVSPDAPFRDVSFTGSGRHLATVDAAGWVTLWNPATWMPETTYNWEAGPLTCVRCTADGLAGVCGTRSGHLLLFDVDE